MASRRLRTLAPYAALAVALAAAHVAGWLGGLEGPLRSARFSVARQGGDATVTLVAIDPHSLAKLDRWPWPRGLHASLTEALIEAGARRVAFDIDFSARSIPEEDAEFADALARAGYRVVLAAFQRTPAEGAGPERAALPLPEFSSHAVVGSIQVSPGPDGLTRRYPIGATIGGRWTPSLATALLDRPVRGLQDFAIDYGIDLESIDVVSYVDVLTRAVDPNRIRDHDILVGATALELGDSLSVPRHRLLPGCMVQALAYESIRRGRTLGTVPVWLVVSMTILLGLIAGPWLANRSWRNGLAASAAGVVAILVSSIAVQAAAPLEVPVVPWCATLLGCYGVGLLRRIDRQALTLLLQRRRLRRVESRMRHVVASTFDAIVTLHGDGSIETLNPAAERLFCCRAQEVSGRPLDTILLPASQGAPLSTQDHQGAFEAVGRTLDGRRFPVEMTLSTFEDDRRVAVLRDIAERRAQQDLLRHQATHDALTGLPNRYLLQERLRRALDTRDSVALLLLDLDRFKEINDTLGHETGDQLLCSVGERLRCRLDRDETIARLGGDEFAIVMPNAEVATACRRAHGLAEALQRPFRVGSLNLQVEAAIGIALSPQHGVRGGDLTRRADVAMYLAKRDRSTVEVYDAERDPSSLRALALGGDLRRAIEGDGLWLAYQPKVDSASGKTTGVEALVRWRHPRFGDIRPDEFIGPAEQSGLIVPLTRWVVEAAVAQAARWRARSIDLTVSINVSARNLLDGELVSTLSRALDSTRVPPRSITLEITESAIMTDPERAMRVVRELSDLGVAISIDDFGTGYSSLGYLRRFPASELKIDRSFVQEMDRNADDAAIVRSTIELAHNLGMKVVAEGVETDAVWSALRELGCDIGQGYLFGKPVPADELALAGECPATLARR